MQGYWKRYSFIYRWTAALAFILLFSCAQKEKEVFKPFNPQPPEIIEDQVKPPAGSLYTGYGNLFSDDKAYQVGDIITIKVVENISGSGSANSSGSRDSSVDLDFPSPTIMGKQTPNKSPIAGLKAGSKNNFKGTGKTDRKAKLIATISARVVKVYPNGNLFIVGKKIVKINEDEQILKISGIVKPTYIEQDNSVLSDRISDMYVEYNGKGFIADNQKPGWLSRFLVKIWPF
ncbi:MAG TPA: flagellar basal body L-ring protein FlgH [Persephonella sp.]|uniref:flagellar basal body L-ring protein FlgH n=1 Tax=Persephonella TaxID=182899 RepID=UPI0005A23838|nr:MULTISPECIES: flagellar basal body L-ring protein FlgH [Persephonella]HCB69868.1 flagellar basal body L-ring protein FlgH [Persephonella sp.]